MEKDARQIRLLIADDHTLYRQGLREACESQADMEVIGEAENGHQAVEQALALQPDVILMDVKMPLLDGIQATQRIIERLPQTGVIVLTVYRDPKHILDALQAGARAHFLKDVEEQVLLDTVRAVRRGEALIDSQVTALLLQEFRRISLQESGML